MSKFYVWVTAAALMTAASLSSCSKSNYAFQPSNTPYHQYPIQPSKPVVAAAKTDTNQATVVDQKSAAASAPVTQPPSLVVATQHKKVSAPKMRIAQQLVVNRVAKKLGRIQTRKHHEAASASEAQSKASKAAVVTIVGLLLWLLGAVAGVGIIALIGFLAFIVGIILLIIALVNS